MTKSVWKVSGKCVDSALKVSGLCQVYLQSVWTLSANCLESVRKTDVLKVIGICKSWHKNSWFPHFGLFRKQQTKDSFKHSRVFKHQKFCWLWIHFVGISHCGPVSKFYMSRKLSYHSCLHSLICVTPKPGGQTVWDWDSSTFGHVILLIVDIINVKPERV